MERSSLDDMLAAIPSQLLDQKIASDIHLADIANGRWSGGRKQGHTLVSLKRRRKSSGETTRHNPNKGWYCM